jgi:methionyl-tRNA formyltransferase
MIICVAGKNRIAVHGLDAVIAAVGSANVIACPVASDDGVSRWQPSLLRYAKERGVKVVTLEELYHLKDLVFLSLGYDRIIKPALFKSKCLYNLHFSKLPAYKGMYPVVWPIINGEQYSGVTLHKIDWGIDTGDVIEQVDVAIGEKYTARDLYFSCMESAIKLLDLRIDSLITGNYVAHIQSSKDSSYYSQKHSDSLLFELNFRQTAQNILRQSRAFHFREYQVPYIGNMPITNGAILDDRSRDAAGYIKYSGDDVVVVNSIDYNIQFERDRSMDFHHLVISNDLNGIANYKHKKNMIDVTNSNGWTPLMMAAYAGKKELCMALIKAGANVNATNQNGTTVLMYSKDFADKEQDFSICKIMLEAGADLNLVDRFGQNIYDYLAINGSIKAKNFFGRGNCD